MSDVCSPEFFRTPNWALVLGEYAGAKTFLRLSQEEIDLLAGGVTRGREVRQIIRRLKLAMRSGGGALGNFFVSTDVCSPTDTRRFAVKRGAVHSAESAWFFLAASEKVRRAARKGRVEFLCVAPFFKIDRTREFRLFIHDGKLKAMSQYNLDRHFRRLEGIKEELWETAADWFDRVAARLPHENMVIDIYLDSDDKVGVIDVNPWGCPTDPLLLQNFDRDWSEVIGLVLMPSPTEISGDVAVSF